MTYQNLAGAFYGNFDRSHHILSNIPDMEEIAQEIDNLANDNTVNINVINSQIAHFVGVMNQENNTLYSSDSSFSDSDSSDDYISLTNGIPQEILNEPLEPTLTTNSDENSEEYINTLIHQYCLKKKIKNDDYKETCAICQDEYKKNNTILLLPCNHTFHLICVKEWFKKNTNCPICRNNIIEQNNLIEKLNKCTNIEEVNKIITEKKRTINQQKKLIKKITKQNKLKDKNSQKKKSSK
jgi:hypothetical protein